MSFDPRRSSAGSPPALELQRTHYVLRGTFYHPGADEQRPLPPHRWLLHRVEPKQEVVVLGSLSDEDGVSSIVTTMDTNLGGPEDRLELVLLPAPSAVEAEYHERREVWIDLDAQQWALAEDLTGIQTRNLLRIPWWSTRRKARIGGGFSDAPPRIQEAFASTGLIRRDDMEFYGTPTEPWRMEIDHGWVKTKVRFGFRDLVRGSEAAVPPGIMVRAYDDQATVFLGAGTSFDPREGTAYLLCETPLAASPTRGGWSDLSLFFQLPKNTVVDLTAPPPAEGRDTRMKLHPPDENFRPHEHYVLPRKWHTSRSEAEADIVGGGRVSRRPYDELRQGLVDHSGDGPPTLRFDLDDCVLINEPEDLSRPEVGDDDGVTTFDLGHELREPDPARPGFSVGRLSEDAILGGEHLYTLSGETSADRSTGIIDHQGAFYELANKRIGPHDDDDGDSHTIPRNSGARVALLSSGWPRLKIVAADGSPAPKVIELGQPIHLKATIEPALPGTWDWSTSDSDDLRLEVEGADGVRVAVDPEPLNAGDVETVTARFTSTAHGTEYEVEHELTIRKGLEAFLAFQHWNDATKAITRVQQGVRVDLMDDDPVGDDVLESTHTDAQGRATFLTVDLEKKADEKIDLFFVLRGEGKTNGVFPLPTAWSTKGRSAQGGEPGYYEDFSGLRVGTASSPLLFHVGHVFHVRFEHWNPVSKTFVPLPAGVPIDLMDNDPIGSDLLATTHTDANGAAHLWVGDLAAVADEKPDVYFRARTQGLNNGRDPLPESWSTYDRSAVGGEPGHYDDFTGPQIGSPSSPLVFRVGLDLDEVELSVDLVESITGSEDVLVPLVFDGAFRDSVVKFTIGIDAPGEPTFHSDEVRVRVRQGGTLLVDRALPFTAAGEHTWEWDGFSDAGVLDTEVLLGPGLQVEVEISRGGKSKLAVCKLENVRAVNPNVSMDWIDVRIDLTARTALARLYVDCQNDDGATLAEFNHMQTEARAGISHYWSRPAPFPVGGVPMQVTVLAVERVEESVPINLVMNDDTEDPPRSHNPGVLGIEANLYYLRGFYHTPNDTDENFRLTAAHEFGHSILQAFGGTDLSWTHKGSTSIFQVAHDDNPFPPPPNEIDLMQYWSNHDDLQINFKRHELDNSIASQDDVRRILALPTINFNQA